MNHYYQDPYGYPMMPIQHGAERILGRPWDAGSGIVFFHFSGERDSETGQLLVQFRQFLKKFPRKCSYFV